MDKQKHDLSNPVYGISFTAMEPTYALPRLSDAQELSSISAESSTSDKALIAEQASPISDSHYHTGTGKCILHAPLRYTPAKDGSIDYQCETACTDGGTGWGNHSTTQQLESPAFDYLLNGRRTEKFLYDFTWQVDSASIVLSGDEGLAPPLYPWHGTARCDIMLFTKIFNGIDNKWVLDDTATKTEEIFYGELTFNEMARKVLSKNNESFHIGGGYNFRGSEAIVIRGGMHLLHRLDLDGSRGRALISMKAKMQNVNIMHF